MKVYAKDSMDRFGDDFTEEVLQYLTFEDKIRLECVSKQWKRCVFQKQFIFEIDFYSHESHNTLNKLIVKDKNYHLNEEALESVLKKCPNITKVKLSYLNVKSEVMLMFGQYSPHIKSLTHNSKNIVRFYRKYGHKLEELILLRNRSNDEIKHSLEFCPNLKILYSRDLSVLFDEDKEFLPKLEEFGENFTIDSENVNKMQILVNKYTKTIKRLDVRLMFLTEEELKKCFECISQFENLRQLKLGFDYYRNSEVAINYCLSLIGQKCNKLLKLDLIIDVSVPISDRFFDAFTHFKAIKKLHLVLWPIQSVNGSVECFKNCKQLNELHICYPKMKEDFLSNIQLFVPNLRSLRIQTREQFSDSFIDSFHSMKDIQKVVLSKETTKYWYFGKSLSEVMLSPKAKKVKSMTNNCGLISN